MAQIKNIPLRGSKAPSLPIPPTEYNQGYQDQLNNVFRLYFSQIDNFTQVFGGETGGPTAERPGLNLYLGRMYFDTTLGIPIWWNSLDWVDATGAVV